MSFVCFAQRMLHSTMIIRFLTPRAYCSNWLFTVFIDLSYRSSTPIVHNNMGSDVVRRVRDLKTPTNDGDDQPLFFRWEINAELYEHYNVVKNWWISVYMYRYVIIKVISINVRIYRHVLNCDNETLAALAATICKEIVRHTTISTINAHKLRWWMELLLALQTNQLDTYSGNSKK